MILVVLIKLLQHFNIAQKADHGIFKAFRDGIDLLGQSLELPHLALKPVKETAHQRHLAHEPAVFGYFIKVDGFDVGQQAAKYLAHRA